MKRTDLKVGEDYGLHGSTDWQTGRAWARPERVRLVTATPVHIPSRDDYGWGRPRPAVIVNLPDAEGVAVKGARTPDKYHTANGAIVREVKPDGTTGSLRAVRLTHLRAPWADVERVLAAADKAAQEAAAARAQAAKTRKDRADAVRRIARKYQVSDAALASCLGRYTDSSAETWRVDPLIDLILTMEP